MTPPTVYNIRGEVADNLGSIVLHAVCIYGNAIITVRGGLYHDGKTYVAPSNTSYTMDTLAVYFLGGPLCGQPERDLFEHIVHGDKTLTSFLWGEPVYDLVIPPYVDPSRPVVRALDL